MSPSVYVGPKRVCVLLSQASCVSSPSFTVDRSSLPHAIVGAYLFDVFPVFFSADVRYAPLVYAQLCGTHARGGAIILACFVRRFRCSPLLLPYVAGAQCLDLFVGSFSFSFWCPRYTHTCVQTFMSLSLHVCLGRTPIYKHPCSQGFRFFQFISASLSRLALTLAFMHVISLIRIVHRLPPSPSVTPKVSSSVLHICVCMWDGGRRLTLVVSGLLLLEGRGGGEGRGCVRAHAILSAWFVCEVVSPVHRPCCRCMLLDRCWPPRLACAS